MKTIWKFVLPLQDNPKIKMPQDARILDVQYQHGDLCLWAEVDSAKPAREYGFIIVGTGHRIPEIAGGYLASIQQNDTYVWHIFEERSESREAGRTSSRRLNVPCPERPELQLLIDKAKKWWDQASENERAEMLRTQRRSWVVGEMLLAHPEMTREEVEKLVDSVDR